MQRRSLLAASAALAAAPLARPHAQRPVDGALVVSFRRPEGVAGRAGRRVREAEPRHQDPGREHPLGRRRRLRHAALHRAHRRQRPGRGDGEVPEHAAADGDGGAGAARPRRSTRWPARSDISDDLWKLHRAPDGKQYYVPLQYVILYLYVRQDWFAQKNLPMPTSFDAFLARRGGADRRRSLGVRACAAAPAGTISGRPSCSAAARSSTRAGWLTPTGAGGEPLVHRPLPHRQGRARPRRRPTGSCRPSTT